MKYAILFIFTVLTALSFSACTEKKANNQSDATVDVEQVNKLEQENQEIETLEQKIDEDIKELDALLDAIQ